MQIIMESDLRQLVSLTSETVTTIEEGFTYLSSGKVQTPPIMRVEVPENNGEIDIKSARVEGLDQLAVKISSGFFDNPSLGLPSGSGLMVLLSARTGIPDALLLDNGYLTDVRTAAAGAIAAKYLAREQVETVGIIGSGSQAHWQLEALRLVRSFAKIVVYSPNRAHAERFARDISASFTGTVTVSASIESLVRTSDIVVTCTPATEPLVRAEWLHPGLHITAMGSDAEFKQELDPRILGAADKVCCDLISQCRRLGELHHAVGTDYYPSSDRLMELGDLTAHTVLGRRHPDQVTVCDLTGTGVQDTMIAILAVKKFVAARQNVTAFPSGEI